MPNTTPRDYYRGYRHPYVFGVHYLGGVGDNPRTLVELAMCQFSAELRRKPEWWKQFQNQDTRREWYDAATEREWSVRTPSTVIPVILSPQQIDYILDELGGYAGLRDEKHNCQVSCFERIWESESLLDDSTSTQLKQELDQLRQHTSRHTSHDDNGVTVSLIDPTLYCLVYNRTFVSHPSRMPRPLPSPPSADVYTMSPKSAMLPSDVSVSPDVSSVKFISYVNNLHSKWHRSLYDLLETCLARFIPLFEHTLTDLHRNNPLMQRIPGPCRYTIWDEPDEPEHSDDEESWANYERDLRFWVLNRPIQLPDIAPHGYQGGLERRKHITTLRGRNLQVIVDVSEIRLSPNGPSYQGSQWHVEGMRNERVVACGVHCLSVDNVTPSSIQFRMAVTYPRGFFAGDIGATLRTWGLRDGDSCHQHIGSVPLQAGFSVVFPNIYQHRQMPFQLADPTKEGHLTLVTFLLVDPDIQPVVSTSAVAPQQKDWIEEALYEALQGRLPAELITKVMENVESVMQENEADDYRDEMLRIRNAFRQANDNYLFCIPFDIWNGPEVAH
ncbi:hypothetical protein BDQ12DRAFT_677465 [Crucibulum laeve]|uniref:Uncharacterized protein n=1 Tax=Crucibulum laeve TaxID=68775 RepID=A0A5C3MC38_9AGAR|nr:hypothetical protein BDQ12DRAFT_677465 [Crucibulum laeve]